MRTLILIALLLAIPALASEAPSRMKGGTITVRHADGTESKVSADEFVVVPRKPRAKKKSVAKPVAVVCPTPEKVVQVVVQEVEAKPLKNRVTLLGGYGPSGFKTSVSGSTVNIETDYDGLFGVAYARQIIGRWSLEAVGLSNKTGLLGVGYSF